MAAAKTFAELCALVERAEAALISTGGVTDPLTRVQMLRGIYYGTPWSRDFGKERSIVRNTGFTIFSGMTIPADPRTALGTALFDDLAASQDIRDRGHLLDAGHALCGIEARGNAGAREFPVPSQGGTGLEIMTWLGDLGGGAANLAWRRSAGGREATRTVGTAFVAAGSDYGAPINLEGDVAGYLIGATGPALAAPAFPPGPAAVAVAFRTYLPGTAVPSAAYMRRARDFLTIHGGSFDPPPAAKLLNRAAVVSALRMKIQGFAAPYLLQRYVLGQMINPARIEAACKNLAGAAGEVATSFVLALELAALAPRRPITAMAPWPPASPPAASCTVPLLAAASRGGKAAKAFEDAANTGRGAAEQLLRRLRDATR